jgi:heme exporter protein D
MSEFVSMGGHGAFVWGSYGAGALLLALEVALLRRRRARALRQAREDAA